MKLSSQRKTAPPIVALGPKESCTFLREVPEGDPASLTIPIRKILVPTDFSDCARQALRLAVPFARQFNASLTVLFVAQFYFASPDAVDLNLPALESKMRRSGEKQLATLVHREIESQVESQVPVETLVRSGQPAKEIVDVARAMDIDLIILSTHGRSGLAHFLLGSTAEQVVRQAPCPVFVVREKQRTPGRRAQSPQTKRFHETFSETKVYPRHD